MAKLLKVFLSHAANDDVAATDLKRWLESVFAKQIDVFASGFKHGDRWRDELLNNLKTSAVVFVLSTQSSLDRNWVNFEIGAANALGKKVIPICLPPTRKSELPDTLDEQQACDYASDTERKNLITSLSDMLGVTPTITEMDRSPTLHAKTPVMQTFGTRDAAKQAIARMIREAGDNGTRIDVVGVAHTLFFGPDDNAAKRALHHVVDNAECDVRLLFLNPKSRAAYRRHIYEFTSLDTCRQIEATLATVGAFSAAKHKLHFRTAPEMPAFICIGEQQAILHPYLASTTGNGVPTLLVTNPSVLEDLKRHFEKYWRNRCLLLDIGNVLVPFNHRRFAKTLVNNAHELVDTDKLHDAIFQNQQHQPSLNTEFDLGKVKEEEFFSRIFTIPDIGGRLNQDINMVDAWCSIFDSPLPNAMEFLRDLAGYEVDVAVCSNTNETHWRHLCETHPQLNELKHYLSFELGHTKNEPEFFQKICQDRNCPPEHLLLVDDQTENLTTASTLDINTLRATGRVPAEDILDFINANYWR